MKQLGFLLIIAAGRAAVPMHYRPGWRALAIAAALSSPFPLVQPIRHDAHTAALAL